MKGKLLFKVMFLFALFIAFFVNKAFANTDLQDEKIKVLYDYNEETNQVTVKIVSTIELKDTKPTWKLSEDKLSYSKTYEKNERYNTDVVDINGNKTTVEIYIKDIKELKLEMQYEFNKTLGQVVAKIVSNIELEDTKPTWELSSDKLTYTKVYTENTKYETPVQDKYGNVVNAKINIDQIGKEKPIIKVSNKLNESGTEVLVTITSDVPLKNTKPTWRLSEDKLSYSKIYTANQVYSTLVEDIYGNVVNVILNINEIDDKSPEITLEYKYNKDDTVTVYLRSNKQLNNTKPTWKLSDDKLTYEKTYDSSQSYSTLVQASNGSETSVKIDFKIKKFIYPQQDNSTIKVRYLYTDRKKATVEIISSIKMKPTKPTWQLSEDGYTYSKDYYANEMYTTTIEDINGVKKEVSVMVNLFDNYLVGIDVSAHQGIINWSEVKNSGIDFAIIRCGYGQDITSQDDKYFARNVAECERLGIPYGIYLYSYALNVDNALSEADHVLRLVKGHNPEYGIWYDLEDDSYKTSNGMPSNETFVDIAVAFCEKMKANGYSNVGIYANLEWWNNRINSPRLDIYPKWVAQWGNSCSYNKPYKIWQYTSTGSVNGIDGNVDMDILYR